MTSDKAYDVERRLNALIATRLPQIRVLGSNQTVSGTTLTTVGPMSWTVVPGQYKIDGMVNWSQGASAVNQTNLFTGPAMSSHRILNQWTEATRTGNGLNSREDSGSSFGSGNTPNYVAGLAVEWIFYGTLTFTAGGTFAVAVATTGGGGYTIGADSSATLTLAS